ncbi:MAG: hypothetical protein ACRDAR_18450, partial [Aeromonas veronii]
GFRTTWLENPCRMPPMSQRNNLFITFPQGTDQDCSAHIQVVTIEALLYRVSQGTNGDLARVRLFNPAKWGSEKRSVFSNDGGQRAA